MYDVSGIKGEDVETFIKDDILHLVRRHSQDPGQCSPKIRR